MSSLTEARKQIKECRETQSPFLGLNWCGISDLSQLPELSECTHLESLDLSDNRISDISFLSSLTGLQSLALSRNQISDISFLSSLTGLQSLTLSRNRISDISFLSSLTGLQSLALRDNRLKEIPPFIFEKLDMEINMDGRDWDNGLLLDGNPIESPPLEIIKQGRKAVLDWFEATKVKLNEIKIILIGAPKAGKTSLLKRLKDNSFSENEPQTDGVNIEDIEFGKCDTFKQQTSIHSITGHFWDFGGQEIMNATHQFFLTKRSVYVLVLDARKDENNATQIRDWVKRIRATGGDSPIIVLANQIDVNSGFGFENQRELQEEFSQIKDFIKISCKDDINIDLFKDKLAEIIPTAELFQTEIDERWIPIKNDLQKKAKKNYHLSEREFLDICRKAQLTKKIDQQSAIQFFHDLGLVLHFDVLSQNLSDYYVLDPYWITYGAYQILTSKYAGNQKGVVSMDRLEHIVNEEEGKIESYQPANYKKIEYSTGERRFLMDILHEFKLCFCVPDDNKVIIPDLLDTGEPERITNPIRQSGKKIQFVYEYDYLPKSIMPNIIVKTHRLIIDDAMWRTGCVLQYDGCKALITSYGKRISITVIGIHKKKREFMSALRFIINSINEKLSNKPKMLIPLPGINDGFAEYERLLAREKKGKIDYIHDEDKPTEKTFTISKLLDGIVEYDKQDEILALVKNIKRDTEEIKDNQKKLEKAIQEISDEQAEEIIKAIMTWVTTTTVELNNELSEKFEEIKRAENVKAKVKLSVPFIQLLGIDLGVEFDIANLAKEIYKKIPHL